MAGKSWLDCTKTKMPVAVGHGQSDQEAQERGASKLIPDRDVVKGAGRATASRVLKAIAFSFGGGDSRWEFCAVSAHYRIGLPNKRRVLFVKKIQQFNSRNGKDNDGLDGNGYALDDLPQDLFRLL